MCRYKDSKALRQGRKYEMLYWDNKASLVVKDTEPNDNATYKCVLSNQFGSAEADATLTVHSKYKDDSLICNKCNARFLSSNTCNYSNVLRPIYSNLVKMYLGIKFAQNAEQIH